MKTLHELIETHRTDDPYDTTIAIFDAIKLPERWRSLFFSVVRDECRRTSRSLAVAAMSGKADSSTITDTTDDHSAHDTQGQSVVGRVGFLAENVYCGAQYGYIKLGEMTVEHHEARIAFQSSLCNGIERDIERHRTWIDQITEAGATCLNDLQIVQVAS